VIENGPTVSCKHLVVATNTPVNDWVEIHTKQAPYRTYVVGAQVPTGSIPRAMFWDGYWLGREPYHYVRIQPDDDYDWLIVGGEDHKTGQAEDMDERYQRLEQWTRERFPMAKKFDYHWSGQVMEPVDGLAFIGHNPMDEPNVYIATGDSGNGMTHGTIAGMLITDLIMGRPNPWEQLYAPNRKSLRSLGEFVRENLNVALKYADWVRPVSVSDPSEIKPGSGALMRRGLKIVAAYKDENGKVTEFSASCTHLQCVVGWNPDEQTWDCPCHGSRFDAQGKVVNGPAIAPLQRMEESERDESASKPPRQSTRAKRPHGRTESTRASTDSKSQPSRRSSARKEK
jgi:nitrite reductase/ring-hydroxylating ferredoxin subunit